MSINKFELTLASLIQDKGEMSFQSFEELYCKSISSLKRYIANINLYCHPEKHFLITGDKVISTMSYSDLIKMVKQLTIVDYTPSPHERFLLVIIHSFFHFSVNISQLYEQMGLSMTTKKKDSREWNHYLNTKALTKTVLPAKGITISGDEAQYRTFIATILSRFCELNYDDQFLCRRANTPLERMIFEQFETITRAQHLPALARFKQWEEQKGGKLSYPSKKFLLIYLNLSLYRMNHQYLIEELHPVWIQIESHNLFVPTAERLYADRLIASFDFTILPAERLFDHSFQQVVIAFLDATLKQMTTQIHTYSELFAEVYDYLRKSVFTLYLREDFYDNKLDETHKYISRMYRILLSTISLIEDLLHVTFSSSQIAGLTLIFRKYVMKNRVVGRNTKTILIVTNSAIEKSNFFFELLSQSVDVKLAGIVTMNELYLLNKISFDEVLVFSNRIKMLLDEIQIRCLRLNFYITPEDVTNLLEHGFSTAARKINTAVFIEEMQQKSPDEMHQYLMQHYADFFIG